MVATNTRCQGLHLLPGETGWGGIDTFHPWVFGWPYKFGMYASPGCSYLDIKLIYLPY